MDERIITGNMLNEDLDELSIRPQSLKEYVGQTDVKENMNIFIKSALRRYFVVYSIFPPFIWWLRDNLLLIRYAFVFPYHRNPANS